MKKAGIIPDDAEIDIACHSKGSHFAAPVTEAAQYVFANHSIRNVNIDPCTLACASLPAGHTVEPITAPGDHTVSSHYQKMRSCGQRPISTTNFRTTRCDGVSAHTASGGMSPRVSEPTEVVTPREIQRQWSTSILTERDLQSFVCL